MLEEKVIQLIKAMNDNKPKEEVKGLYEEYVEAYKSIKVPKAFAMIEFKDIFFLYNNYIKKREK